MIDAAVKMININFHKGHPILERSPTLKQYAQFIERVAEEKDRKFVTKLLKENWAIDKIQKLTEVPRDRILEIKTAIGA